VEAPTLRPLRVGEILDVCINIFTRNFLTFLRILLVLVIPVQLVSVVVLVSTVNDPDLLPRFGSTTTSSNGTISQDDFWAYFGGQMVIVVLTLVLTAIATAACFKAVSDAYLGTRPEWRSSLRFAVRRFHSVLWVTIMAGLLAGLGLIALIAPGVWLFFAWSMAVPALLFEGLKGRRALGRSFRLVRGRWWKTAGTLVAAYIIAALIGGILQSVVSALVLTGAGDSVLGVAVVNAVAGGIGQIFTTPFPAAVAAVVYYDLRVRKEGFDLQLMAERLGVTPPPPGDGGDAGGGGYESPLPPAGSSVPVWERQAAPPPPPPSPEPPAPPTPAE
jgi:hypothetical protein